MPDTGRIWHDAVARGLPFDGWLAIVNVPEQLLILMHRGCEQQSYPISTSRYGISCAEGSYKTPSGWHEIADRIGYGSTLGTVFTSREPDGRVRDESEWRRDSRDDEDLVMTRILRLRGLEPGVNAGAAVDSYRRYIYIHGTNHEIDLGRAESMGCIRMGNRDVAAMADLIGHSPAWVWIPDSQGGDRGD